MCHIPAPDWEDGQIGYCGYHFKEGRGDQCIYPSKRFDKEIVSAKEGGEEPIILEGDSFAAMAACSIEECFSKGIRPG